MHGFNPRAREGATVIAMQQLPGGGSGFNPRAREGATKPISRLSLRRIVSIHAPVRARR